MCKILRDMHWHIACDIGDLLILIFFLLFIWNSNLLGSLLFVGLLNLAAWQEHAGQSKVGCEGPSSEVNQGICELSKGLAEWSQGQAGAKQWQEGAEKKSGTGSETTELPNLRVKCLSHLTAWRICPFNLGPSSAPILSHLNVTAKVPLSLYHLC